MSISVYFDARYRIQTQVHSLKTSEPHQRVRHNTAIASTHWSMPFFVLVSNRFFGHLTHSSGLEWYLSNFCGWLVVCCPIERSSAAFHRRARAILAANITFSMFLMVHCGLSREKKDGKTHSREREVLNFFESMVSLAGSARFSIALHMAWSETCFGKSHAILKAPWIPKWRRLKILQATV